MKKKNSLNPKIKNTKKKQNKKNSEMGLNRVKTYRLTGNIEHFQVFCLPSYVNFVQLMRQAYEHTGMVRVP